MFQMQISILVYILVKDGGRNSSAGLVLLTEKLGTIRKEVNGLVLDLISIRHRQAWKKERLQLRY